MRIARPRRGFFALFRLTRAASRLLLAAAETLFPLTCCACGADLETAGSLCVRCAPTFVAPSDRACAKCGGEAAALRSPARRARRCARCRGRRFAFVAAVAGLRYRAAVRELVLAVKFHERPEGLAPLVAPLCRAIRARGFEARTDCVAAVPLHPLRRFFRGFDQAELLARAVAADLGKPFEPLVLRRRVFRRPQSLASRERRFANLAGGFAPGRRACAVRGKRVLLVDDVLTSGATADAASHALRAAGAKAIYVAVAAT